ncbi:hypothetical protein [Paraburkholderia sp. BCC1886]|uniref:hypothetical protein n=1 Tax=Paraburkholderia sp. BCC1886 TaxID=2562670 RepID=UPI001181EEE7|nr:hypothetical protein [Paraburkholderia sp. BCC1886]
MNRTLISLSGSFRTGFIDNDIMHIARVMGPSLHGDMAGPILSAGYWRKRLEQLLAAAHLSHTQLLAIDELMLQLEAFEANPAPVLPVATNRRRHKAAALAANPG